MKNIYILNEYYKREFHSNLLLATEAASKKFDVYLGTMDQYGELINKNLIKPGIFHTKSVTHDKNKSDLNKLLKKLNFKLTVHDQEHGILENNYKSFCKTRITEKDLRYFDAFFCWGKFDFNFLKKKFIDYKSKFFLTGSPRVDLWKQNKKIFFNKINTRGEYILIVTNFSTSNNISGFKKVLKKAAIAGYYKRYPRALTDDLNFYKYQKKLMSMYIEMIKNLSYKLPGKKIIIRPHPTEESKFWKRKFLNFKNISVIDDGILSSLISGAEIIIQSGCTSSIESFIGNKKVINFLPLDKNQRIGSFVKKISKNIYNFNDLISFIKKPKFNCAPKNKKDLNYRTMYLKKEYAVKKMVKIFSRFKISNIQKNSDFKIFLQINLINKIKCYIKYFILLISNKKRVIDIIEHKYFYLDDKEINKLIIIYKDLLKIKKQIKFKIFSNKFIKVYSN
jgi:surface carbohydrate biosynthesis protein